MKTNNKIKFTRLKLPAIMLIFGQAVIAWTVTTTQLLPDTAKLTYDQISQTMKLYVFPATNQSKQTQKGKNLLYNNQLPLSFK